MTLNHDFKKEGAIPDLWKCKFCYATSAEVKDGRRPKVCTARWRAEQEQKAGGALQAKRTT